VKKTLVAIAFPPGLTKIGFEALRECATLEEVSIPNGVTTIGMWAFHGCWKLKVAAIPDTVVSIGDHAFAVCGALVQLTLPPDLPKIAYSAFDGCSSVSQRVLPAGVTVIVGCGLANTKALKQVTIPPTVDKIRDCAFGWSGLTRLTITANTTSLLGWTFYGCEFLAFVSIPAEMKKVDAKAFNRVKSITRVELTGTKLSPELVAALEPALAPGAQIVSAALAGQRFGAFTIVAA
jgi:hypothetical protein